MEEVNELLEHIAKLKREGLTGIGVAANFALRRIQPLKERVCPAYDYAGEDDPVREVPDSLTRTGVYRRLSWFFIRGTSRCTIDGPITFSLGNPRPEDRVVFLSQPVLLEFPPCVDTDVDASILLFRNEQRAFGCCIWGRCWGRATCSGGDACRLISRVRGGPIYGGGSTGEGCC
ncbi:unnamed protein product [Urochloa humidicola]